MEKGLDGRKGLEGRQKHLQIEQSSQIESNSGHIEYQTHTLILRLSFVMSRAIYTYTNMGC